MSCCFAWSARITLYLLTKTASLFPPQAALRQFCPIRGGTDGARLSYEGLPCPNLSTGGENFHGVHEFGSVPAMKTMVKVLTLLAE